MGTQTRRCDGSDERRSNHLFRHARGRLRTPAGTVPSRREIADLVNVYLYDNHRSEPFIDRNYVGKIESGRIRWPSPIRRAAFRHVLGVRTDADIGFWPGDRGLGAYPPVDASDSEPATELARSVSSAQVESAVLDRREVLPMGGVVAAGVAVIAAAGPGGIDGGGDASLERLWPVVEWERRLALDHREQNVGTRVGYWSVAADRLVLDWLVADAPSLGSGGTASAAAQILVELRQRDHRLGAGQMYESVASIISRDLDGFAVRVPRLAIGFLELAGYEAVDLGADGIAQSHYLRALDIATRAGEQAYGGYLIGVSLAHLALHCGDATQALRLATAALRGTERMATPAVRAALYTVAARAYARLGQQAQCTAQLRRAEAEFMLIDPGTEPEWISYFREADFADERAHCFFDLGHHDLVDRELDTVMSRLDATRVRRLAIDTALRAASLARRGEVEQACAVAATAIEHAAAIASFRSLHRIVLMMADLRPYMTVAAVAELCDYARITLPLAPALASR